MNVLVTSENRFVEVDGTMYTDTITPTFFQRYLDVWDEVLLVARVSHADRPPPGVSPMDFRGVRLIDLPNYRGSWRYLKCLPKIRAIARQALQEADSVLFRMAGVVGSSVWPLLRDPSRPFGVEICGDPGTTRGSLRHPLRPLLHWYYLRDMRRICQAASATAYVTREMFQKRYPPAANRLTTHYSSIELDSSQVLSAPREFSSTQRPYRLICVGTFSIMYKGQDVLLQALARVVQAGWDLKVTFVGDGRYQGAVEQLARDLGVYDRVEFRGSLPAGEAVLAELDQAHLFVLPSRQDGLPRVVIEAMARGLPCLGSDVGGIPELIGPEELVPPNDPSVLANKIVELVRDPARMTRLSQRNLQVAAGFTSDVLRTRRIKFYEHLSGLTDAWIRQQHRRDELQTVNSNT